MPPYYIWKAVGGKSVREIILSIEKITFSLIEKYFPYRFEDQGTISTVVKYVYWSKNNLHDEEVFLFSEDNFSGNQDFVIGLRVMSFVEIYDFLAFITVSFGQQPFPIVRSYSVSCSGHKGCCAVIGVTIA